MFIKVYKTIASLVLDGFNLGILALCLMAKAVDKPFNAMSTAVAQYY